MMEEKIHKQISDAIDDGSGQPDDDLKALMNDDEEVAATFLDVNVLEQRLRAWGYEDPPRQYWKSFPSRVTSRLYIGNDDDIDESLFEPPAPDDEDELAKQESADPSDDAEEGEGAGLAGLAALAGRSTLPPAKNFDDDDGEIDEEAVIDLGALIAKTDDEDVEGKSEQKGKSSKKKSSGEAVAPSAKDSRTDKPALASPTKAAAPAQQPSNNLYYVVGLLFVALLVVGYIAFGTGGDDSSASEDRDDHATVAASAPAAESNPSLAQEEEPPVAVEPAPQEEEEMVSGEGSEEGDDLEETSDETPAANGRSRRMKSRSPATSSSSSSKTPTEAAAAPARPAKSSPAPASKAAATSDLDALLAGATSPVKSSSKRGSGSAGEAVQAAVGPGETGATLPPQPSRSQVRRAMGSVAGQVMACRSLIDAQTRVNATVNVANSGAVRSASVSGGTPAVQQCVKRAVQRARFPRFSQPSFSVTYPFVLSPPE